MTRYFFDFRDGTEFILDGEGLLIRDMAACNRRRLKLYRALPAIAWQRSMAHKAIKCPSRCGMATAL